MRSIQSIPAKIVDLPYLIRQVKGWKLLGKKIVFTNGVFDILHEGHIASLSHAASLGEILIVGVNNDESVKKLKGPSRPIHNEATRALLLASMMITDAVILFGEETPLALIKSIMPDVLMKGGDYSVEAIAGAKEVIAAGGEVILGEIVPGISTTAIIEKMKHQ